MKLFQFLRRLKINIKYLTNVILIIFIALDILIFNRFIYYSHKRERERERGGGRDGEMVFCLDLLHKLAQSNTEIRRGAFSNVEAHFQDANIAKRSRRWIAERNDPLPQRIFS